MTTATPTRKLNKAQAKKLHDAEVDVKRAKARLDEAEEKRQLLRDRYHDLVPVSDDAEEASKGIRKVAVGEFKIRIAPQVSGDFFRLRDYKAAGHPVTPEMAEHISPGRPFDRWTVNGPAKKSDAVEPEPSLF